MRLAYLYLTALVCAILPVAQGQTNWPHYGNDPGGMRYSQLEQINTENVTKLQLAWKFETEAPITREAPRPPRPASGAASGAATPGAAASQAQARPRRPRSRGSDATPLVIDGVMYLGTGYNRVVALVPETGEKIWEYESAHKPATRGIAFWSGDQQRGPRVVVGTNDGYLFVLDAKTGQPADEFGDNGIVNLRIAFGEDAPAGFYGLSSPPTIYKDLVITGGRSGERPERGLPGDVHAWDVRTGKLVWTFHTVPQPGEANHETWHGDEWRNRAGANAWGFITLDVENDMLFVPLATPNLDFYGGARRDFNLYGSSLVALDAPTGKLKWFFQTTHHDNWDYDLSAPPALIHVWRNGKKVPAVAQMTKQTLLFILNRLTGEPIYEVEERPVISDNTAEGDEPWPTQPFPVKPPPLGRTSFSPDEVAKVTPEHEAFCKALLAAEGGVLTGGPYAQYGPKLRVIFPGWTGGGNWSGVAFDPVLGYLFTNVKNLANYNKLVPREDGVWARVGPDEPLPNSSGDFWDREKHWPCQEPPWGELSAVNVNTGDIVWRVPLGVHEELELLDLPKTGRVNIGGPIVTAGGLLFIGATSDDYFRAFDVRTGEEIWATKLHASAHSVPITYEGKDGKQYVAIMASGGHSGSPSAPGILHVFSLP